MTAAFHRSNLNGLAIDWGVSGRNTTPDSSLLYILPPVWTYINACPQSDSPRFPLTLLHVRGSIHLILTPEARDISNRSSSQYKWSFSAFLPQIHRAFGYLISSEFLGLKAWAQVHFGTLLSSYTHRMAFSSSITISHEWNMWLSSNFSFHKAWVASSSYVGKTYIQSSSALTSLSSKGKTVRLQHLCSLTDNTASK